MTKVAIIDDHGVVRMGLKWLLASRKEYEVVGEWDGGEGALEFVCRTCPDVVLLDIKMPDKDGISVLKTILSARSNLKVVMLTTSDADNDIYEALNAGAKGYLIKDRDGREIFSALETVMQGGTFVPPAVKKLYDERKMTPDLTPKEKAVLEQLRKGLTNDAIAETLSMSYETVKVHLKNIFNKLDVTERLSAVREAERRGFLR